MQNSVSKFGFGEHEVRVFVSMDGEPWWAATDVCRVLGPSDISEALEGLDAEERNTVTIDDGIHGNPHLNFISESGLYTLIFKSHKPEAPAFKRWVLRDVLPAIRKTARYSPPDDMLDCTSETAQVETVPKYLLTAMAKWQTGTISIAELKTVMTWAASMNAAMEHKRRLERSQHRRLNETSMVSEPADCNDFWEEVLALLGDNKINRSLFSIRHVWLKQEGTVIPADAFASHATAPEFSKLLRNRAFSLKVLSSAELPTYPNALHVMFMHHKSVFGEYRRQLLRREEHGIESLDNLRRACATHPWFLLGPAGSHRQRLGANSATTRCWCIALDTFTFAQEFTDRLKHASDAQ